ncbi:hypothetical protein D3C79_912210 [compost metagenome]
MAGQPAFAVAAEHDGFALGQLVLLAGDADVRGNIVHEDRHITLQAHLRIARNAAEHGKTLGLPLGPEVFVGAARQQRLRQGVEQKGGVFAEAGEVAGGVVAGEGGYKVGGGLAYLKCLVHGSGLTVIVIVVKRFWWGLAGEQIAGGK